MPARRSDRTNMQTTITTFLRGSLLGKAILAVTLALLPPLVSYFVSVHASEDYLRSNLESNLSVLAESYEAQVYQYLNRGRTHAADFATDLVVREYLADAVDGAASAARDLGRHLTSYKLPVDRSIRRIDVLTLDGRLVASTDPGRAIRNGASHPAFRTGRQELYLGGQGRELLAAAPVSSSRTGGIIGVLINVISLDELDSILTGQFSRQLGAISWDRGRPESLDVYIVGQEGRILARSRHQPDVPSHLTAQTEPVDRCLAEQQETVGIYLSYHGNEVVGASMCLPTVRWTLLVEAASSEVLAPPLRKMRRNTLLASIAVFGVLAGLFTLFFRTVIRPLRLLTAASRRIAAGEQGVTAPEGSPDEIGSLARAFNEMAQEIQARTAHVRSSEERLRKILDNTSEVIYKAVLEPDPQSARIEFISVRCGAVTGRSAGEFVQDPGLWARMVHPDDMILFRAMTKTIIEAGRAGTRTYRIRRAGDGQDIWIEDRIVPEVDAAGAVVGWWGSARDITERMQMLESLRLQTARLTESQRIAHLGTWEWDMATNALWWSDEIYHIFGVRPGEFEPTYENFLERVHPDDRQKVQNGVDRAVMDRQPYDLVHRIVLRDGTVLFAHEKGTVRYDLAGRSVKMVGTVQDITPRQRMEDAIRESEQRFRSIFNSVHDGILVTDVETRRFFLVNETICSMLGYRHRELSSCGQEDVHLAEELPDLYGQQERLRAGEVTAVREVRLRRRDGTVFSADMGLTPMVLEGRNYVIGLYRDITEQKKSMEELRMLSAVIEHSVNVVFITNREGNIEYVNPTFERITGWIKEEAIGRNPRILASGHTTRAEYEEMWSVISSGRTWRGAFQNRKKDGRYYWGNSVVTPISNDKGEITHFLAVQEDITERKIAEDRLEYLAAYDELTGLLNRGRFMENVQEWISHHAVHTGGTGCLLIIDIDDFKYINETRGHATGDEVIKQMGAHLAALVAGLDAALPREAGGIRIARLGGDEFAVFLPLHDGVTGHEAAERIRSAIERFRPAELTAPLTASIGAVVYPLHGSSVKELFTKADAALYRSKRTAKNQIRFFRPEDHDLEYAHSRLRQKENIQSAIAEDRFLPWFQPILRIEDGVVSHYEALARLRDKDGRIIYPAEFIEAAEAFGLVGTIDRTIAGKTMLLQRECAKRGQRLHFGMNLSGKELGDEELLAYLQRMISETGADPGCLIFEITETAAVHDLERARKFINALKTTGCRFSLDDFGVGFTSFLYLRELGVDYIKIDGSFVRNLPRSRNDQLFVKAIIDVARGMGIKTIAEFVESEEILGMLRTLGVDYAQGYFIGKPAPEILRFS